MQSTRASAFCIFLINNAAKISNCIGSVDIVDTTYGGQFVYHDAITFDGRMQGVWETAGGIGISAGRAFAAAFSGQHQYIIVFL